MTEIDPLPFRLSMPGRDTVGFDGVRSVSYKLAGMLHLQGDALMVEWTGTESTESVSLDGVETDVVDLPMEWIEVPVTDVAEVRVRGGWWRPRLVLRGRRLDVFDDIPTSSGGAVSLGFHRRHRALARDIASFIELGRAEAALRKAETAPPAIDRGPNRRKLRPDALGNDSPAGYPTPD